MTQATTQTEIIEKSLSARETLLLAEHERTIVTDFAAFYRVGQALAEISRLRLYRTEEGRTFERYCKEIWDMSKGSVYRLIDASTVYDYLQLQHDSVLSPNGRQNPDNENGGDKKLPLNERQIRPLTRYKDDPARVKALWNDAVALAPDGKVTAGHVNKAVRHYMGDKFKKTVRQAQEKAEQAASPEFAEAFEKFTEQIKKERDSKYKHTSRGFIIQHLDQLRAELAEDGELIEEPAFRGGSDDANKLERAGYRLLRADRTSMTIKNRGNGGWLKHSGPFETIKEMEGALDTLLQDDMNLRG